MNRLARFRVALLVSLASLVGLTTAAAGGMAYERHAAASVTARMAASISATESSALDQGTVTYPASLSYTQAFSAGTGNNQADVIWCDTRTIAASQRDSLDLSGVLSGALATATFAKVKGLVVTAAAGNTNNVVVGGAAGNTWTGPFADATDKLSLKPGYALFLSGGGAGYTVTNSSADALVVANSSSGTSVTYSACLLGTSS